MVLIGGRALQRMPSMAESTMRVALGVGNVMARCFNYDLAPIDRDRSVASAASPLPSRLSGGVLVTTVGLTAPGSCQSSRTRWSSAGSVAVQSMTLRGRAFPRRGRPFHRDRERAQRQPALRPGGRRAGRRDRRRGGCPHRRHPAAWPSTAADPRGRMPAAHRVADQTHRARNPRWSFCLLTHADFVARDEALRPSS